MKPDPNSEIGLNAASIFRPSYFLCPASTLRRRSRGNNHRYEGFLGISINFAPDPDSLHSTRQ